MTVVTTGTIGCDLGDKTSTVCCLNMGTAEQQTQEVKTTRAGMREFFTRPPAQVVMEVGTHSRWVSELVAELGHEVIVANPRRLKLITQSDSKNDKTDAEMLARLGRADAQLLSPVKHRGTQAQADLAVLKVRDTLVSARTMLVNQARGLVKSFGERLPKCEAESFHRTAKKHVPAVLLPALDPVFQTLEAMEKTIKEHDKTLESLSTRYPEVEAISQVNGVGLLTAMVFLLTLEDKTRFTKSRQAGAFIGLRPKQDQSGNTDKQLPITKAGDPFLRRLLVISANYVLGPFGKDSDLRRWGLELARRGGKNARKRAKVAVARKLAVLMHRLWVTGEEYKPLGYAQRETATS